MPRVEGVHGKELKIRGKLGGDLVQALSLSAILLFPSHFRRIKAGKKSVRDGEFARLEVIWLKYSMFGNCLKGSGDEGSAICSKDIAHAARY